MMSEYGKSGNQVLLPRPLACTDRAILVMLRRMGGYGLRDAQAAMLAMRHFGNGFRQPLTLMRCFVAELAQASQRNILIANCCAPKMTLDEGLVLEAVAMSCCKPDRTRRNMDLLTGGGPASRAITVARALNIALENAGSPLEG